MEVIEFFSLDTSEKRETVEEFAWAETLLTKMQSSH